MRKTGVARVDWAGVALSTAISHRTASGLALVVLFLPADAAGFDGTLLDAVARTLQQQSSIGISKQAIVAGEGRLAVAKSTFETNVIAAVSSGRTLTPIPGRLPEAPLSVVDSHVTTYHTGVTRRMRSGLTVNPAVTVTRTRDNHVNASVPSFAAVAINFTLPLLKGSGTLVNTAAEVAAQLGIDAATEDYRDALSNAIVRSVSAYWDYLAATRILDIARTAEARSETLLDDAAKLAKGDEIPRSDILKYEAKLARDRTTRFGAEQNLGEAGAALGLAFGLPDGGAAPIDPPRDEFPGVEDAGLGLLADAATRDTLSQLALRRRFDLLASEYRLHAAEILLKAARADNKPQLDVTASVGYTGLAEGKSGLAAWSALQHVPKGANVSLGLTYVLPVSNYENTGLILQRAAAAEQARLERDTIAQTIRINLKVRLDHVRAASLQLQQTGDERRIVAEVFENEKKRYRLGAATVLDLLTSESQLTAAQISVVDAQRNFAQALVRYRAETSTLLDPARQTQTLDKLRLTSLPNRSDVAEAQ